MSMAPKKEGSAAPATATAPAAATAKATAASPAASGGSSALATAKAPAIPIAEAKKELATALFQLKRAETAGKMVSPAQAAKLNELVAALAPAEVQFHGIIGRCWLKGHDCHFFDPAGKIELHLTPDAAVPTPFEAARAMVPGLPSSVWAIAVYSDRLQLIHQDGSTEDV